MIQGNNSLIEIMTNTDIRSDFRRRIDAEIEAMSDDAVNAALGLNPEFQNLKSDAKISRKKLRKMRLKELAAKRIESDKRWSWLRFFR